jgi:hypothetical protein
MPNETPSTETPLSSCRGLNPVRVTRRTTNGIVAGFRLYLGQILARVIATAVVHAAAVYALVLVGAIDNSNSRRIVEASPDSSGLP